MDEATLATIRAGVISVAVASFIILLKVIDFRRTPVVAKGGRGLEEGLLGYTFLVVVISWLLALLAPFGPEIWVLVLPITIGWVVWFLIACLQAPDELPPEETLLPATDLSCGERSAMTAVSPSTFAIDGSNIAAQQGFDPAITTSIARALSGEGHTVRVFFDANVGFRMGLERHISVDELSQRYDFPASSITIVPGGTVADGWILRWAVHNGATIITNDQYRDHREAFPKFDFERKIEKASAMGDDIWLEHRPNPITYTRAMEPEEAPTDQVKPSTL